MVEAVPESLAGIGNTEGLHDPSADAMTNGGLQTIQPIQANCCKHIFSQFSQFFSLFCLMLQCYSWSLHNSDFL